MSLASSITTTFSASWAKRSEARRRRNELCETVLMETKAVWRYLRLASYFADVTSA